MRLFRAAGIAAILMTLLGQGGAAQPMSPYAALSEADIRLASRTVQQALETSRNGQKVEWINSGTGASGAVTPLATYVTESGVFCRRYREDLRAVGVETQVENRACRNPKGIWIWVID